MSDVSRSDPDRIILRRGLGVAAGALVAGWALRLSGRGMRAGPFGRPWWYWASAVAAAGLVLALYALPGYLAARRRLRAGRRADA